MLKGYMKTKERDYENALTIYQSIYDKYSNDAALNYRIGQLYLNLKSFNNSIEYLNKARKIDPSLEKDIPFLVGQAYHSLGHIDSALTEYEKYKNSISEKEIKDSKINDIIKQCNDAKWYIKNPVNVKITKLGDEVNSKYVDASPSLTADGKTLIFTSRRPENVGGEVNPATGEYKDDIYISYWIDSLKRWSKAIPAQGKLNTAGYDASLSISPDGKYIFVYRNVQGETKSGDIYISRYNPRTEKWGNPKNISKNINSSYFETSASLSSDGKTLYFVSERSGGFGNGDIWVSKKIKSREWSKPTNIGKAINTEEDEIGVFIHPNGKTLFFTSKGHGTIGGYDVFQSTFENGEWSNPVNLGYPINTTKDEIHFVLSTDGKRAYISSKRDEETEGIDIYEIDMSNYSLPNKDNKELTKQPPRFVSDIAILRGLVIDENAGEKIEAEITVYDSSSGEEVEKISSDEFGEYFFTLKNQKTYKVKVSKDGYETIEENVNLTFESDRDFVLVKHFILKKKRKK